MWHSAVWMTTTSKASSSKPVRVRRPPRSARRPPRGAWPHGYRTASHNGTMPRRVNRAVEQLAQDQAIYYLGGHTGHVLSYEQGKNDSGTWADYINVGMEHGSFDMAGLAAYMQGLVDGGPTESGHRTPTVVVEAPVNGT